MSTGEYRKQIDEIDDQIISLFAKRMEVASHIAEAKKENHLPVLDPKREREKLLDIIDKTPEEIKEYSPLLYSLIFEISRSYQNKIIGTNDELTKKIQAAIDGTDKLFPDNVSVACQGVEGANSQIACDMLFKYPRILYFSNFEAVFSAIEKGLCKYGVIPLENSTAGSVNSVYDLMMKHKFSIVRSIRAKITHNLLVKPGTKLEDIKTIYSHEQAISQCSVFLSTLKNVEIIPCENTAVAAKKVSESEGNSVAALASIQCMKYYGLECLRESVQNTDNNYTRFICISKNLEIYPGADRTSIMLTLPHEPGSLYKMLSRFYALDINLIKLESRPLPNKEFEFMFYFDLETPVYSPKFLQLMGELPSICDSFQYLGSYNEVI